MLSFSTEFPVKDASAGNVVGAIKKWIEGSPHTKLVASDLDSIRIDGRSKVESGSISLESLCVNDESGEISAFRYLAKDKNITWVTEIVSSKTLEDDWVAVRTSRLSENSQIFLPNAKKPLIIRTLINELGGGLDDELFVKDSPYFVKDSDTRMVIRLLNADAENRLPIVYVSAPFSGERLIKADPLARVLGGLAHVIVEPSRSFSRAIQPEVGSRNVYGGYVGIYWPDGSITKYYPLPEIASEIDIRFRITSDIRIAHLNRRPLDRCTWARAEARFARQAIESLRSAGSDNIDDYVAAFDAELRAKDAELEVANAEIWKLRGQFRAIDSKRNDASPDWRAGNEQEFKPHEFDEIIKDALLRASEFEQEGGRRKHVILAVAEGIAESRNLGEARDKLKEILKNYSSMDSSIKTKLSKLGFTVSDDGKHVKLVYMDDDRYTFSLPKSGSDWRGGQNAVSDIGKRVF